MTFWAGLELSAMPSTRINVLENSDSTRLDHCKMGPTFAVI